MTMSTQRITPRSVVGTATPHTIAADDGVRPCMDFDSSTSQYADCELCADGYASGGLTVEVSGAMDSANTGTKVVGVTVYIERVASGDDLGSGGSDFAAGVTAEITVDNTADNEFSGSVSLTDGAQVDSLADGDDFRIRIERKTSGLTGTNASGDWQWLRADVSETV